VPEIIRNLFESTLQMINQNFTDYTDFRRGFFTLCKNIVFYCVEGLYISSETMFQIFIDSIIWAFKHEQPELAELGLSAMSELITQVSFKFDVCNPFFKTYFMPILQDTFYVLTDGTHKGGFQIQIEILKKLFSLIEEARFTESIVEGMNNKQYILEYLSDALSRLFNNMNKV
jgi:exportin-1